MNPRLTVSLVLALAFLFAGCASIAQLSQRRFQGHWEMGSGWEGFVTTDGHAYMIKMPPRYDNFFMQKNLPVYHTRDGQWFFAAYVEVEGSLAKYPFDPAMQMLTVSKVYSVAPAKAALLQN